MSVEFKSLEIPILIMAAVFLYFTIEALSYVVTRLIIGYLYLKHVCGMTPMTMLRNLIPFKSAFSADKSDSKTAAVVPDLEAVVIEKMHPR